MLGQEAGASPRLVVGCFAGGDGRVVAKVQGRWPPHEDCGAKNSCRPWEGCLQLHCGVGAEGRCKPTASHGLLATGRQAARVLLRIVSELVSSLHMAPYSCHGTAELRSWRLTSACGEVWDVCRSWDKHWSWDKHCIESEAAGHQSVLCRRLSDINADLHVALGAWRLLKRTCQCSAV